MSITSFRRLVRFIPKFDSNKILIGQPKDDSIDIGLALFKGQEISVNLFSGSSVLKPGELTESTAIIERILSPLSQDEIGTIRCIGLNHATEVGLDFPAVPHLFMKPNTSLASPWPEPIILPKLSQNDDCGDYESELAVVIGKPAKNVSEENALDYVLGYTACNDISSRSSQFQQSQWCFSKSFDTSCPIGPCLVSPTLIPDVAKLRLRGIRNQKVVQDCGIDDLIFSISKLISFLSQSTTLPPGTIIISGTPSGVGFTKTPKLSLKHGDEFAVEILPYIGTLINKFENEK